MRTKDLKVGMAVAFNQYRHGRTELAYVVALRPKEESRPRGYYGRVSYGKDTVGLARSYNGENWFADWVRPDQIVHTWDEELKAKAKQKEYDDAQEARRQQIKLENLSAQMRLPRELLDILVTSDWRRKRFQEGEAVEALLTAEVLNGIANFLDKLASTPLVHDEESGWYIDWDQDPPTLAKAE